MSVTVTVPATERDLTTAAAVVERLSLSAVPSGMEQLIAAVSRTIERYCGRTFAQQTYEETVNGSDTDILLVTNAPIIGTPTIAAEGSPVTDFTVRNAAAGMLFREAGWATGAWVGWPTAIELDRLVSRYPMFVVTYEAGYKLPGETDNNLPPDIEEAAIMTAMQWYRRDLRDSDIKSKKIGDLTIAYDDKDGGDKTYGIPAMARALLPRRVV